MFKTIFSKDIFVKKDLIKRTAILVTLTSLFLTGCNSNSHYQREVDGNDDYLNTPTLKPLVVPKGMVIPAESSEFYIYRSSAKGSLGKEVDIRPPLLPIPTTPDTYANYDKGVVKIDAPVNSGIWNSIPGTLKKSNIMIEISNNNMIKTAYTRFISSDENHATDAAYLLERQVINGRENITIKLLSLKQMGQNVINQMEIQRYTVILCNQIMEAIAPPPVIVPPSTDSENRESKDKN